MVSYLASISVGAASEGLRWWRAGTGVPGAEWVGVPGAEPIPGVFPAGVAPPGFFNSAFITSNNSIHKVNFRKLEPKAYFRATREDLAYLECKSLNAQPNPSLKGKPAQES